MEKKRNETLTKEEQNSEKQRTEARKKKEGSSEKLTAQRHRDFLIIFEI